MGRPAGIREDVWSAMRSARLWREASDADVEWLAQIAQVTEYDREQIIYPEGSRASEVTVVVDGHARAINETDGRRIILETFWPGDVIGAMAGLGNVAFESDIQAAEPMVGATVPVGALRELLIGQPAIALSVINELAARWIRVVGASKRNAADVTSRVANYLADLPRTRLGGSAYAVEIPVSRVELSALLGTTPETLSRAFHSLQQNGFIESHDRMIIVPDADRLTGRDGDGDHAETANTQ